MKNASVNVHKGILRAVSNNGNKKKRKETGKEKQKEVNYIIKIEKVGTDFSKMRREGRDGRNIAPVLSSSSFALAQRIK